MLWIFPDHMSSLQQCFALSGISCLSAHMPHVCVYTTENRYVPLAVSTVRYSTIWKEVPSISNLPGCLLPDSWMLRPVSSWVISLPHPGDFLHSAEYPDSFSPLPLSWFTPLFWWHVSFGKLLGEKEEEIGPARRHCMARSALIHLAVAIPVSSKLPALVF